MRRWWVAAVIFVAGTAIGGTVVWVVARDDGGSGSSTKLAADKAKPSAPAQELLDRIAAGEKGTYHVRYTYSGSSGTSAVMEVWRKADRVRRDLTVVSPVEGTARTQEFLENGTLVRCLLIGDSPWQCTGADVRTASALRDPLNGVNHDVAGKTVQLTTENIAGQSAKCYSIIPATTASSGAKPTQFCFSAESAPLRIDGGDGKPVEATDYDLKVDDSVFTYPAKVAGLAST
ncbi:MAG TPA: hypothetical protein VFB78_19530 [Acidimicrobiales bacterium]|nr:hypothetical protein [Acidimicrobiales bacterium]